ncbi:MAG TPA: hypothetical protein VFF67_01135 [Thermoplasmata archaeon]|nr:hypothetical protein [Thermoplasmata archaeon]
MVAGSAGAAAFHIVTVAPYKGGSWGPYLNLGSYGCSIAKVGKIPFFQTKTGLGGFAMATKTNPCAINTSRVANYGAVTSEITVYLPVKSYPGSHTIITNWTINITSAQSLTPGHCVFNSTKPPYSYSVCTQVAMLSLNAGTFLWDLTSGVFAQQTNPWPSWQNSTHNNTGYNSGFFNSTGGGPGGLPSHLNLSSWINVTMVKGDNYTLNSYFIGTAYTEIDGRYAYVVGGNASSTFLLSGLGNGLDLRSITII